ncbi:hypothetical protein ABTZ03_26500 [Kitasatospora sp. NPDC096077]|uniref:hypothetical protein n=1 Tax=Kitasatospora sp. NPDC096077 TaxID=3155544 RepID=UPI00331F44EA
MSPAILIPRQITRQLSPAVKKLAPLLSPAAFTSDGILRAELTCRAAVATVRRQITAASAVYVVWDVRGRCRYVGSVHREAPTAVSNRLAEHHQHRTEGGMRREEWALLTVLPMRGDASLPVVLATEGWAARILGPLDGVAHPQIDLARPPAVIAAAMGT